MAWLPQSSSPQHPALWAHSLAAPLGWTAVLTNCRWVEKDGVVRAPPFSTQPFLSPPHSLWAPLPYLLHRLQGARSTQQACGEGTRIFADEQWTCSCSADLFWGNACCLMFKKPRQNISLACILQVTCHLYYSCITQQDRHLRRVCVCPSDLQRLHPHTKRTLYRMICFVF